MSKNFGIPFMDWLFQDILAAKADADTKAEAEKEAAKPPAPPFDLEAMCADAQSRLAILTERDAQQAVTAVLGTPLLVKEPGYPQFARLREVQARIERHLGFGPQIITGRSDYSLTNGTNVYLGDVALTDMVAFYKDFQNLRPVKLGPINILMSKEAVGKCSAARDAVVKAAKWM